MKILKAYKFKLKTSANIEQKLAQAAGCRRFVWNKALAIQKERLDVWTFWEKIFDKNIIKDFKFGCLFYRDLASKLVSWKKDPETKFLKDCPSQPLQQTLRDLSQAIKDSFDKSSDKKFPVFKRKGKRDSFRIPFNIDKKTKYPNIKIDNKRVKLPKIGWIRFFKSREIKGNLKNITISRKNKDWFISFQTEINQYIPSHPIESEIGIDLGVAKFAVLSNKEIIYPVNAGKELAKKIAKQQRILSRKKIFSSNWKKQNNRINKLYQKVRDKRHDFLHKNSTRISKSHAIIYLEELKVKNMSKSAKGTEVNPGQNVKAKSGLNRSILDQGWAEFRRQIEYKSAWNGGQIILVNPKNTSRKCPKCGFTHADNRKTQEDFNCLSCGYADNADYIASLNILTNGRADRAGTSSLACGEVALATSLKQEPVGNISIPISRC